MQILLRVMSTCDKCTNDYVHTANDKRRSQGVGSQLNSTYHATKCSVGYLLRNIGAYCTTVRVYACEGVCTRVVCKLHRTVIIVIAKEAFCLSRCRLRNCSSWRTACKKFPASSTQLQAEPVGARDHMTVTDMFTHTKTIAHARCLNTISSQYTTHSSCVRTGCRQVFDPNFACQARALKALTHRQTSMCTQSQELQSNSHT